MGKHDDDGDKDGFSHAAAPQLGYQQQSGPDDAAIRAREEALSRREAELNARERQLDSSEGKPNWPPFYPLLRHSLDDIDDQQRETVKWLYYLYLALVATLLLNLVGCIVNLAAGEGGVTATGTSGMYVPVIGGLAFATWYRPIYLGFRKGGFALFFCGCPMESSDCWRLQG